VFNAMKVVLGANEFISFPVVEMVPARAFVASATRIVGSVCESATLSESESEMVACGAGAFHGSTFGVLGCEASSGLARRGLVSR
jgi:hypothetical protein